MNRLETLITILMKPFQRFENVAIEVLTGRAVDTAIGVQLDVLGKLVGQARNGLSDDDYRRYIRARIATNRATGKHEELIRIVSLIVSDDTAILKLTREGTATARLVVEEIAITETIADAIFAFLSAAIAAGVRIVITWGESPFNQLFRLDLGPGLDQGHLAGGLG